MCQAPISYSDIEDACNNELKDHPGVQFCSVFGSFASGKSQENSDIDVAIAGNRKLSCSEKMSIISRLSGRLNRPIDIVDLQSVSGTILHQAVTKGRHVFIKDTRLYAGIIKRMLYNQADMMPNYNMILRKRREEFLYG